MVIVRIDESIASGIYVFILKSAAKKRVYVTFPYLSYKGIGFKTFKEIEQNLL